MKALLYFSLPETETSWLVFQKNLTYCLNVESQQFKIHKVLSVFTTKTTRLLSCTNNRNNIDIKYMSVKYF